MKKGSGKKKRYKFSSVLKAVGRTISSAAAAVKEVLTPVLRSVGKVLSAAWKAFFIKLADLKKWFDGLDKEKQRYVAAGVVGGFASLLLLLALVIGISSISKERPVDTDQPSSETRELSVPEATPTPIPEVQESTPLPTDEPEAISSPSEEDDSVRLKKHDRSPEVETLQKALISLGYLEIDEPTDYFGSATEYAVKLFQRQHGLEQDGVAGQQTLSLLYSDEAQRYTLKEGAEGRDVKMLQEQLSELGYMSSSDIDSIYGEGTTAAVTAFQKRNGLTADGIAGQKTLDKLFSDDAKISKEKEAKEKAAKEAKEKEEKAAKATPEPTKKKQKSSSTAKATTKATAKPTPKATPKESSKERRINRFINAAKSKVGCEYVVGGHGPDTFDCSGFVYWCLKQAGVNTSRLNAAGYSKKKDWQEITSISNIEKGDILFFHGDDSSSVSHTGIYIGGGMMIDASSSNGKVVKRSVSSYWKGHFVNARRPW